MKLINNMINKCTVRKNADNSYSLFSLFIPNEYLISEFSSSMKYYRILENLQRNIRKKQRWTRIRQTLLKTGLCTDIIDYCIKKYVITHNKKFVEFEEIKHICRTCMSIIGEDDMVRFCDSCEEATCNSCTVYITNSPFNPFTCKRCINVIIPYPI